MYLDDIRIALDADNDGAEPVYYSLNPMFEKDIYDYNFIVESTWDLENLPLVITATPRDSSYTINYMVTGGGLNRQTDTGMQVVIDQNIAAGRVVTVTFWVTVDEFRQHSTSIRLFKNSDP